MRISLRHLFVVLGAGVMFVAGTAYADLSTDRYYAALANVEKATALLNAVTTNNNAEKLQRDKAIEALADADDDIRCALVRRTNPNGACP